MYVSPELGDVFYSICCGIGTAEANAALMRYDYGGLELVLERTVRPIDYVTPSQYRSAAAAFGFLRKLELSDNVDRLEGLAYDSFFAIESSCARANARLSRFLPCSTLVEGPQEAVILEFLSGWRKIIRRVLGPIPSWLVPTFSQGATLSDNSRRSTLPDKLSDSLTIYADDGYIAEQLIGATRWADTATVVYERSNRFFTVPKDVSKRRSCAVEASGSLSLQLAVGKVIEKRLSDVCGIHISERPSANCLATPRVLAPERHKRLARESSLTGEYATLDLSNASDTVCRNLVKLLLPSDWYNLLNSLRAKFTSIRRGSHTRVVRLEKFSSMGNGFTFPLETLIFHTLSLAVLERECVEEGETSTFGDDMIVPSRIADAVIAALRFFGLETNVQKTFISGSFRESCGGDFFLGENVRPYFPKKDPNEPQEWIALANGIYRLAEAFGDDPPHGGRFRDARAKCLSHLPGSIRRLVGPSDLGDTVITVPESVWRARLKNREYKETAFSGTRFEKLRSFQSRPSLKCYLPISEPVSWRYFSSEVILTSLILGVPSTGPIPRDSVSGYRISWVPVDAP